MQVADKNRITRTVIVLSVICFVLQIALAPNVALGNGRANFAFALVASCAVLLSPGSCAVAGFVAGLVFDLSSTAPIGLMAFCLTVASFCLGLEQRNRMAGDIGSAMGLFCAATLGVSLVYHLAMLLVGQASSIIDVVIFRALPAALLTVVFFVPFAYYYSRVRVSGPGIGGAGSLKAGAGRGTHFTRRGL